MLLDRYSGISEKTLQNVNRTLRDVQAVLLSMFNSKTILIGHSLESDLKALKLIHDMVVDTSILYPHKMGPPKKRALKTLCIENLKRIIQEDGKHSNFSNDHMKFRAFPHRIASKYPNLAKSFPFYFRSSFSFVFFSEGGHNSAEDAEVCIDLVKHYLRNRIK